MNNKAYLIISSFLAFLSFTHATPTNLNDWTETFNCKGGLAITHKPDTISWKTPKQAEISSGNEIFNLWMNPATHTPLKTPLALKIQSSREDFKNALITAALMDPDPAPATAATTTP